jgi:plastocyanin
MVFAVNCPSDDSPNSFANFKKAALAIGDQLKGSATAAPPASASATPTPTDSYPWSWTTAPGGYSYPADPSVSTVTVTVTVDQSTWTTTYGSYPGSAQPTPAALNGVVHEVVVGNNGTLTYDPPFVMAQPRDTISFKFVSKNHTVTQSTFGTPCLPAINSDGAPVLTSGFVPVSPNTTDFPSWNITVNTTDPLWFFCEQVGHCGKGMVFAVNPVQSSPRNFSAFQSLAQSENGTNTTSSSSAPNSTTSAPTGKDNGAGNVAINAALGLGSVLAVFALAL